MRKSMIPVLALVLAAPAVLRAAEREEPERKPEAPAEERLAEALERVEKRLAELEERLARLEERLGDREAGAAHDIARRLRELAEELERRGGPERPDRERERRERPRPRVFRWPPREGGEGEFRLPPEIRQLLPREWGERLGPDALAGRRVWLGVSVQGLTPGVARILGLEKPEGALVNEVAAGGPAEKAGLEPGDVILRLGGREVRGSDDLVRAVREHKAGEAVEVVLVRKGEEKKLTVTLAAPPAARGEAEEKGEAEGGDAPPPAPPGDEDVF